MINLSIQPNDKNLTQHIMKHTEGEYWYVSKFLQVILSLTQQPRILNRKDYLNPNILITSKSLNDGRQTKTSKRIRRNIR
jgi:hypothetical protein